MQQLSTVCIAVKAVTYDIGDAALADLKLGVVGGPSSHKLDAKLNFDVKGVPQRKQVNVTAALDTVILT